MKITHLLLVSSSNGACEAEDGWELRKMNNFASQKFHKIFYHLSLIQPNYLGKGFETAMLI